MRRRPARGPVVPLPAVLAAALALAGCDSEGQPPAPTATSSPVRTPVPTTAAGMDDASGTTRRGTTVQQPLTPELRAGAVLTNDDTGAVVRLSAGEQVTLRLTPPLQDSTPSVSDPGVVEVVPVQQFADPGYDEYVLLGRTPGQTRLVVDAAGTDGPGLLVLVQVRGR